MELQNMIKLLDKSNQPYEFRTKISTSQSKFKTMMLRSSSCDFSDAHILAKETINFQHTTAPGAAANNVLIKKVLVRNCATFIDCMRKTNNTQEDNAKYIDAGITICNLS